ncbi:two-component sensor histidine kinase [Limoniibacter endophyticus]|uniref:histidine kinase n=1 Tax=Limoniibacter endophyticus TaxID=1565040 RepID=A0A8J3GIB6_9HYPH|nr:two-component sensor histidine kinase [Limoniibacter endophyticus]
MRRRIALFVTMLALAFPYLGLSAGPAVGFLVFTIGLAAAGVLFFLRPRQLLVREAPLINVPKPRRTMEALSATRLADAVADPIFVFNAKGIVVFANSGARDAFEGVQPGTHMRLRFRAPEMQNLIDTVLQGGEAEAVDYAERLPMERLYHVEALPLDGPARLFVMVFRDQSEMRRLDRMRADFIANASHELRTPLASVSGFIETLQGPAKDDPKARDAFLQIMQAQTTRMARLIDDLLSLSRLEMKPRLGAGRSLDIRTIVSSVIDSLSPMARNAELDIDLTLPSRPLMVHGNQDELFQVFQNLLENACKYGQSGKRVEIFVKANEKEAEVSFRDFGPGIPEEHIPRLTERFYRVDVEKSRTHKGTGLGLSIVKHILTRHHGRLDIVSKLGEGSTFSIILPLAKGNILDDELVHLEADQAEIS